MATLIFPLESESEKLSLQFRWSYASILGDIVRGSSDAIDALTLFRDLLLGRRDGPSSIGFMGFDAHGGDTGCQLRAGMLQEVFTVHRELMLDPRTKSLRNPDWIDTYLDRLTKLNEAAKYACAQLTQKRVMPSKFGFDDKQDSAQRLLLALGWDETISEPLYGEPTSYFLTVDSSHNAPSFETTLDAKMGDLVTIDEPSHVDSQGKSARLQKLYNTFKSAKGLFNKLLKLMFDTRIIPEPAETVLHTAELADPTESQASATLSPRSDTSSADESESPDSSSPYSESVVSSSSSISEFERSDVASPLSTSWSIKKPTTLVRFLVFSYTLSKYKQFCRLNRVVGARVCPELAMAAGAKMIEPYSAPKNVDYKSLKIPRYRSEFATYQAWLSDFSCAWMRSLAIRSAMQPGLEKLMIETVQKSAKSLTSMACYPGYLLLREAWARSQCTMILLDRHFCPFGYHRNMYYATLSRPESTVAAHPHTMGLRIKWHLRRTSLEELLESPAQSVPHLTLMGNSIVGDYAEYFARVPETPCSDRPQLSCLHLDGDCSFNAAHRRVFEETDHDRLTLAFFAAHKSYAFPLASGQPEQDFVEECIKGFDEQHAQLRATGSVTLSESWHRSREDAEEMGSGHGSLRVFALQHMALETKERIARMVQANEEEGSLLPLGADVPV